MIDPRSDVTAEKHTKKPAVQRRRVIGIAASAGGLKAVDYLLSTLLADFPVPIIIVQHISPHRPSMLVKLWGLHTTLNLKFGESGESLLSAHVYIAPPDHHITIRADRTIMLTQSNPVHFSRPSADVLFESMARNLQQHAVAVILSGFGYDGADGALMVKNYGGIVIAQDEATSEHFGMPETALKKGAVHHLLPLNEIAPLLVQLANIGIT